VGRGAARDRGAGDVNRSTHAGAVVFKLTAEGPRYLLVEANGRRDRWVFPKGHVEDGETAADTALRELTEEAGVRARPVQRLRRVRQRQEGRRIAITYFLMAYAGRGTPLDKRRTRWLRFDEAIEALDLEKNRRVLRSADRLLTRSAGRRIRRAAARLAKRLVRRVIALLPPGQRKRRRKARALH
jgi:bis(5'-nucleosidyl)-tetraphosphatase